MDHRLTRVAYPEHFSRCIRGRKLLKTLAKLREGKKDGRNHAMSIDRENVGVPAFNPHPRDEAPTSNDS